MTASDVLEPIDYFFDINKMGPPQFHTPSVQHISLTQNGHSFSVLKIFGVELRGCWSGTEG